MIRTRDISDIEVIDACRTFHLEMPKTMRNSFNRLKTKTDAPDKVIIAAMERACSRGLIEYGGNIISAWPTEKGLDLLIEKHIVE